MTSRILYIEDIIEQAKQIQQAIEAEPQLDAKVDIAINGEEAVACIAEAVKSKEPYHLIILDMAVPLKSNSTSEEIEFGLGYLTQLRDKWQLLHLDVPIVVYTQFYDRITKSITETLENCKNSLFQGANDYILKRDPDSDCDNTQTLVSKCIELLSPARESEPEDSELSEWFEENLNVLIERFGGKVIARVETAVAHKIGVSGEPLGGYVLVAADSYGELCRQIVDNPELLQHDPAVMNIPLADEFEI